MADRGRILKYIEMCQIEGLSLQKGMNYCPQRDHSIFLMSLRADAPYRDRVEDDGRTLIYEGHDAARTQQSPTPKLIDQPKTLPSGSPTENGKFFRAAERYKSGGDVRSVRVYEKLRDGIWADNGSFNLIDAWQEKAGARQVFKFKLVITDKQTTAGISDDGESARSRIIPSAVKQQVWLRDGGRCTICDATDELHFDHIIPYTKGGSSLVASNVQLLCARHNLKKSDKIE